MSTSTTVTPVIITDAASISGFNRGPITTLFAAPPSCTATVSLVDRASAYYVGHYGSYYDPECYPSNEAGKPASNWDKYYCTPCVGMRCAYSINNTQIAQPYVPLDGVSRPAFPASFLRRHLGHRIQSTPIPRRHYVVPRQ